MRWLYVVRISSIAGRGCTHNSSLPHSCTDCLCNARGTMSSQTFQGENGMGSEQELRKGGQSAWMTREEALVVLGRVREAPHVRQPSEGRRRDYGCSKIFWRCFSYSSRLNA